VFEEQKLIAIPTIAAPRA